MVLADQMQAYPALVRGNRCFAEQDYSVAIRHYTEALEEDEEDVTALCNRSAAYYCMELYKTSLKDADAALAIDNTCAKAWERRGLALMGMGRKAEGQKSYTEGLMLGGDIDSYLNILRQLGLNPPSKHSGAAVVPTPASLARAAASPLQAARTAAPSPVATRTPAAAAASSPAQGSYDAHSNSNQGASSEPASRAPAPSAPVPVARQTKRTAPASPASAAGTNSNQGDGVLTITASRAAQNVDPAHMAALAAAQNLISHGIGNASTDEQIALGYLQVNTGRYKEGMEIFNNLLKRDKKLIAAYLGRGTAYALQGNLSGACKDFSQAIEIDPNCSDAWKRRGQTRAALGQDGDAIQDLTKAAGITADHECFHQRGIVYHKMHDYRKALADFRKALDLEAKNHITWNFVGLCENSLGRTREAIIAYDRATQIEPSFKEAWANLAQAHRDGGDRVNAEKHFARAFTIDARYVHGFHLRGLLNYGCGEIRQALADFSKGVELDPNDHNCQLMKSVCMHSLGNLSGAVAEYSAMLRTDPAHQCYYQKELVLYFHRKLDSDIKGFNPDVDLDAYFKEAYCKRHPTNHPRLCNYVSQKPLSSKIPDVKLSDSAPNPEMATIVDLSRRFGKLIQLNTPGFLSNLRQHRMCGLAIIHMAQQAAAHYRAGGKDKGGGGGGEGCNGVPLSFDPKGSSKDNGKAHEFGWRDFMDIGVKWRQISEPNDPVFWIDLLAPEAFAEGFGLQTPMVTGQMNVVRYYPYFSRALEVVKKLIADSGACNVHDQRFMLPRNKLDTLKEATSCQDVWNVIQKGFYVETPCHSIARPGKIMAGTRITLLQHAPDGYDFTIRTPGTPPRWVEMDQEMTHVWKLLTLEARRKEGPDLDKFTDLALTFYFYYVNFGPLSRGTAATGYIAFFALMLSIGYEVHASPPEGTQVDWPAILTPRPSDFAKEVGVWINPARTKSSVLDEAPDVAKVCNTPRKMVQALNVMPLTVV